MKKYNIKEYIDILKNEGQLVECYDVESVLGKEVEYLSYNSNDIKDNTLFICKGFGDNFKEEYLIDALKKDVFIYVSTKKYNVDPPAVIVKDSFVSLCILSGLYFNYPQKELNMIGITGTKGKSTTLYFTKYILDEYAKEKGKKDTAIISSIYTYDGVTNTKSTLTTPESLELYKNFNNAKNQNIENLVMEVSSQALKLGRVYNIEYDIAAFLNISEDHIGPIEHPDFNDYFNSKLKIFEKAKIACVNLDSQFIDKILNKAKESSKEIVTFSTKNKEADVYAKDIRKDNLYTIFTLVYKDIQIEMKLTVPGLFNVENALAAIAISISMNIPLDTIQKGLLKAKSEGRMELYHSQDEKIVTIVDYAHNKLSFQKIFETTKAEYPDRKIISIFGCTGNKAQIRRKDLGEEAGKNSDYIYLTADDPAFETVQQISEEISQYVKKYTNQYEIIEDRTKSIERAVERVINSNEKYIILILGKGNEKTQKVGSKYEPYPGDAQNIKKHIEQVDSKG